MKFWPFKSKEDPAKNLLWTAFNEEYKPIRLRTKSEATVKAYQITLRHLERFLDRPATLDDLNDEEIGKFLDWRRMARAARTVNRDLTNLQAIADWLWKRGRIGKTLTDLEPYVAHKLTPKALSKAEIERVWAVICSLNGKVGRVDRDVFWKALFLVFWDTGERMGAVTSLRLGDLDRDTNSLICRAQNRKFGRNEKAFQLAQETVDAIDMMLEQRIYTRIDSYLFHFPYSKDKLWQGLGQIMAGAGLPDDKDHKFHMLRRTVASHMKANGGDATEQLGHTNAAITQQNYIDPRIAKPPAAIDFLFRPDGSDGHSNGHPKNDIGE